MSEIKMISKRESIILAIIGIASAISVYNDDLNFFEIASPSLILTLLPLSLT